MERTKVWFIISANRNSSRHSLQAMHRLSLDLQSFYNVDWIDDLDFDQLSRLSQVRDQSNLVITNDSKVASDPNCRSRNVSIIYVSSSSALQDQPAVNEALKAVVYLRKVKHASEYIPNEICHQFPLPASHIIDESSIRKPSRGILYMHNEEIDSEHAFYAVSEFVNRAMISADFIVPKSLVDTVRGMINPWVRVLESSEENVTSLDSYRLVIATGKDVAMSLAQGVPTVVVGPKGLGGIVRSNNFHFLEEFEFLGRFGGECDEPIPYWALHDEIDGFFKNPEAVMADTKDLTSRVRAVFSYELFLNNFLLVIDKVLAKQKKLTYLIGSELRPKVVDNIKLVKTNGGDGYSIIRGKHIVVGQLSSSQQEILQYCNGEPNVDELSELTNIEYESLISFLLNLEKMKIISLN